MKTMDDLCGDLLNKLGSDVRHEYHFVNKSVTGRKPRYCFNFTMQTVLRIDGERYLIGEEDGAVTMDADFIIIEPETYVKLEKKR